MQQFSLPQKASTMISAVFAAVVVGVVFFLTASQALAAAPNMFTSQAYSDANGDGRVDTLTVGINGTMPLTACDVTAASGELAADWTYVGNDIGGSLSEGSCVLETGIVTFTVTGANAGVTSHSTAPTIAYANAGAAGSVANAEGALDAVVAQNITDSAKPAIITAATSDNDGNGTVDRLVMTFSESVTVTDGGNDDDITLVASSGTATVSPGAYGVTATTLTYTIATSVSSNTSLTVTPTYVVLGAGSIIDGSANEMNNGETVAGTDGAKPAVLSATFEDGTGNDGKLDLITVVWSENISAVVDGTGDWAISSAANFAALVEGVVECNSGAAGATECKYNFTTTTVKTSVGDLTLTYTAGTSVTDGTNTALTKALSSGSSPAFTDGAEPAVLSATFYDATSGDGKLDLITVVWSEDISAVVSGVADWALTSAANFAGIVEGTVECNSGSAAANECDYNFTTTTVKTSVGDLSLAYTAGTSVTDGTNDALSKTITSASTPAFTDGAKPVVSSATFYDATSDDGKLDKIIVIWSENLSVVANGAGDWAVTSAANFSTLAEGTVFCNSGEAAANECYYNFTTATAKTNVGDLTLTYTAGTSVTDGTNTALTKALTSASSPAFVDAAEPVLLSASPADGGTAGRTTSVTMTMSETAASATATTNTGVTLTCTIATVTITCAPTGSFIVGSNVITLATAPDAAANALNSSATVATNPYTVVFTGSNTSTSGATTSTTPSYSLSITSPEADEDVAVGEMLELAWSTSGSTIAFVDISYSTDGSTYTLLANDIANDGAHTVTIPDVEGEITLMVAGTDLVTTLASDTVSVNIETTEIEVTAPSTGETGTSPVTGEEEDISVVNVGDYIRSSYFSTIYYIDTGMIRRPFMDAQTFMTYEDDFSDVSIVTDATLPTMTLGAPMLPKAGVVLVKIQSDAKVYYVEENADGEQELRWVTSEQIASDMFGSAWADYVIDVNVTLFPRYESGEDIDSAFTVDRADMKTRAEVNS